MKTFNLNRFGELQNSDPKSIEVVELTSEQAMFRYGSVFEQTVANGNYVVIIPQQVFKRTMDVRGKKIKVDSVVALIYNANWQLEDCILFGISQLTKKSMGTFSDRSITYGTQCMKTIPKTSPKGYIIPAERADVRMITNGSLNFVTKEVGKNKQHLFVTIPQVFHKIKTEKHCFPIFNPNYTPGSYDLWKMEDGLICLELKNCGIYEKVQFNGTLPTDVACLPCPKDLLGKVSE